MSEGCTGILVWKTGWRGRSLECGPDHACGVRVPGTWSLSNALLFSSVVICCVVLAVVRFAALFNGEAVGGAGAAGVAASAAAGASRANGIMGMLLWRVGSEEAHGGLGTSLVQAKGQPAHLVCCAQPPEGVRLESALPPSRPTCPLICTRLLRLQPGSVASLLCTYALPLRYSAPCALALLASTLHSTLQQCGVDCAGGGLAPALRLFMGTVLYCTVLHLFVF